MSADPKPHDPWVAEALRVAAASAASRPRFDEVPRRMLVLLGLLAAARALGLVLIAEGIARGIAALADDAMAPQTLRLVLICGLLGALLRAGAEWATAVVARRIATDVKQRLRIRLWGRLGRGGSRAAGESGVAVLAADGLDALDDYFIQSLPALISAAVVPLFVGARILGADVLSAVIIVLTVPLVPLFMTLIGKHTQQRTDAALIALTRLADHLGELARGLPVLVGLGRVAEQARALDDIQRRYRRSTHETLRWAFLSALALELISTISVAVVAVFLGLRLLNGTMGLEAALVALILAPECFTALREVGTAFHASQDGLSALERATTLSAAPAPVDARTGGRGEASAGGAATVRVVGLGVRYAGRTRPALLTTDAAFEGITAVVGASGAGKSTLLAALAGVLPSDAEVSGVVQGIEPDAVAWAPQRPRAFAATPREELALYGGEIALLDELGLAARADAAIAELSPGELRRLAVARALVRADAGAEVLILDEPTAHLDALAAERVRAAVRRRAPGRTVILATHEPETLALASHRVEIGASSESDLVAGETAPSEVDESRGGSLSSAAADVRRMDSSRAAPAMPGQRAGSSARRANRRTGDAGAVRDRRILTLTRLLRPHAGLWVGSMALAALAAGLAVALTAVSGWLIVRASVEEYIMYLLVAIVGVRAFGIGRAVARYAERLVTHRAAFDVVDALRLRLWHAIAARGAGSRRLLEGGAPLDYLVTLAADLRDQLPRVLPPIAAGVLVTLGTIVAAAAVMPHLTLIIAVGLAVAIVAAAALAIIADRDAAAQRLDARSAIVRGTAGLASAGDDLRGNATTAAALRRLESAAEQLARAERRAAWSAGLATALLTGLVAALAVLVPVLSDGYPAELVSIISLLVLALIEPLVALVQALRRLPGLHALLRRFDPVLRPMPSPSWGVQEIDEVTSLRLDTVSVRYPGASVDAVQGISASVSAGEWLVLDGPSGSGKSTLLSAVMGALPVASGRIMADGRALTEVAERGWRDRVAWCPQDAYVFDSTLRGNLLLARARGDEPDDAALRAALTQAGLAPLLAATGDDLDTRVGPGGAALSGGERQRLAVARALLTRADIILLDEPTAHLDHPTAAAMMADVRRATAQRAVLLVSHRPADRRATDTVLSLA